MYGGKFASQNRFGQPYSWKEIYRFCFVFLCKVEIWNGIFWGLIFGPGILGGFCWKPERFF